MKRGEFVAKRNRHPDDPEHYVGFVDGVRVGLLYRPDPDLEKPWGVQRFDGAPITWHETEDEAADAALGARPDGAP